MSLAEACNVSKMATLGIAVGLTVSVVRGDHGLIYVSLLATLVAVVAWCLDASMSHTEPKIRF